MNTRGVPPCGGITAQPRRRAFLWRGLYAVELRQAKTRPGMPGTYFVPREGGLVRVTARNFNQLRLIRTELELLDRIRRRAETCDARPAADLAHRYVDVDRAELSVILRDARRPIVLEMIELFDREFPEPGKDIMMAVVNDESENIVQEAAEAGLVNAQPPVEPDPTHTPPSDDESAAAGLKEALSEAEVALDETVKLCQEGIGANDVTRGEALDAAQEGASVPEPVAKTEPDAASETLDVAGNSPTAGASEPAEAKADDTCGAVTSEVADDHANDTGKPAGDADHPNTADRAAEAVKTFERGIRKTAATLRDEVVTQWEDAKQALAGVSESGRRASETGSEIEVLLGEIKQLRDKARSAMDDLTKTQQQARLLREDALRAKQRAEVSASAADQASREAQHVAEPVPAE